MIKVIYHTVGSNPIELYGIYNNIKQAEGRIHINLHELGMRAVKAFLFEDDIEVKELKLNNGKITDY